VSLDEPVAGSLATRLADLCTGLDELLACLEAHGSPEPAAVEAVWRRVQARFEGVHGALAGVAQADEAVQTSLAHCRRLYAVALGMAARRRDELSAERTALGAARSRLRRVKSDGQSGGSCDVRG
jgi:hypothetical protein